MKQLYRPLLVSLSALLLYHPGAFAQKPLHISRTNEGGIERKIEVGGSTLSSRNGMGTLSSGLVNVYQGESVTVSGAVAYPGQGKLLPKIARGVGVSALTYFVAGKLSGKNSPKGKSMQSPPVLGPAVGAGLLVSARDIARIKGRPKAYLAWYLYDKNQKVTGSGVQPLTRKSKNSFQRFAIDVKVPADGFIRVMYVNGSKRDVWVNGMQLTVSDIRKSQRMQGGIANSMMLQNDGICLPPVECGICNEESGCYDECECYPWACEPDPCLLDPYNCFCNEAYCDDEEEDPCDTDPFDCDCYDYAWNNPCECYNDCGGDPGGDPDPEPVDTPRVPQRIDCDSIKEARGTAATNTLNSVAAQQDMITMRSGLSTAANERGLSITSTGATYNYQTGGSVNVVVSTSAPGMTIVAGAHSHPPGQERSPSPQDLYHLLEGSQNNASYATDYIIAADGSEYALVIEDRTKAMNYLSTYPPGTSLNGNHFSGTQNDNNTLYGRYMTLATLYYQMGYPIDKVNEYALATMLTTFDMGVRMVKKENGAFKEVYPNITYDANHNPISVEMATCL